MIYCNSFLVHTNQCKQSLLRYTCSHTFTHIRRFSCLWCLLDSRCSLPPAVSTQDHPYASVWSSHSHLGYILLFLISLHQFLLFIQLSFWGAWTPVHNRFTSYVGQTTSFSTVNLWTAFVCLCMYTWEPLVQPQCPQFLLSHAAHIALLINL